MQFFFIVEIIIFHPHEKTVLPKYLKI